MTRRSKWTRPLSIPSQKRTISFPKNMLEKQNMPIELAWAGEQQRMLMAAAELQQKNASTVTEFASVHEELSREIEKCLLKSEVEAQWQQTENGEHTEQMTKERDALASDIEALESRTSTMEGEWNDQLRDALNLKMPSKRSTNAQMGSLKPCKIRNIDSHSSTENSDS
ncbi:hypothetical protein PAXRUDRAFT_808182 [Paxillus rubicundulus Ve08.2h10]|uniref:Uncharacterized protein n=1 Tax=Paxillus rubicundulus Ve08.2h10 TaxID=930991 RepID=A0A0D0E1M8_9AGAM|nr:hypothetical protein PAXRUDRAFT_808182 [Paxillus rubicundulus Ve08.2h10]